MCTFLQQSVIFGLKLNANSEEYISIVKSFEDELYIS